MDIRTAGLRMITAVAGSWPIAATYLGMTEAALRNRAYETKGQSLSTRDMLQLQEISRTTLFAQAVAAASGGTFVALPGADQIENSEIHAKLNESFAELGALFQAFTAAIKDDKIDAGEAKDLNTRAQRIHQLIEHSLGLMFVIYCPTTRQVRQQAAAEGET